jgi:hypothetical protein
MVEQVKKRGIMDMKWGIWGPIFFFGILFILVGLSNLLMVYFFREDTVSEFFSLWSMFYITLIIVGNIISVISYFYGKKYNEKYEELERKKKKAEEKASKFQKKYSYYCPGCLFQTNKNLDLCPSCKENKLESVT